ncbi:MAG: DNA mismatch repair endonuclease MutL [Firmicutes bacterium]|nr:DNA mismatch repair endonuclease MutL [Bacillota bacterium]
MSKIRVMDEILANKIAAGEVVERCSSVVKELVENSIDAKSTEIKIELMDAGTKLIKVTDNGIGMDKEDAVNAFSRHATSKLTSEDDLYRIDTLGFRGEALPSIASVSEITLTTSTGEVGTIVKISGGKMISVEPGDARQGTIFEVKNLFYNTPARLKHLKSLYSELASITDYVNKIALSHPDIKFVLINNGNTILNTDGGNRLLKTVKEVYGLQVAKKMIEVEVSDDDYHVYGFISMPEVNRSSRNHMVTIVNGRVVRNQELNRIINDSYHSFKPDTRYPIVILEIEVDPSLIDVNIHPTKMDIKFSKLEELKELIMNMIKEKLHHRNLIPEAQPEEVKESQDVFHKPRYEEQTLSLEKAFYKEPVETKDTFVVSETNEEHFLNDEIIPINSDYEIKEESQVSILEKEEEELNTAIASNQEEVAMKERMPEMYPVGVVHGTYIICQNETGMYLIDQHAAKERINYEFFKKKLGSPNELSTPLLFPITIELSTSEFILVKAQLEVLKNLNIIAEEFGYQSILVKEHPTWLPKGYEEENIRKIIEILIHEGRNFSVEKFNEKIATMMSCKKAIKANQFVDMKELEILIHDLRNCDNPFNCPHGRPTIVYFSNYDLEKLFKRSGFESYK